MQVKSPPGGGTVLQVEIPSPSPAVMTIALAVPWCFKGCLGSSRQFLIEHRYMRQMLSKTRPIRR